MPWPTYTQRFIALYGGSGSAIYTVPEERRVVVKAISVHTSASVITYCNVLVHGIVIMGLTFPAGGGNQYLQTTAVAYERETISASVSSPTIHVSISGYIFTDLEGRPPDSTEFVDEFLTGTPTGFGAPTTR